MSIKFSELSKDFQDRMCTVPQAVFSTLNPDDETSEQVIERQDRFIKLPENVKNKLVSYETAKKIKVVGEHYNLELLQMAPIARVVRNYYFGDVKLDDFAGIIEKESKVSSEDAQAIARFVKERIIERDVKMTEAESVKKLSIGAAIKIYPEIKDQKITDMPIEVDGETAAPTLSNWIKDYYGLVGAGNRDMMKRSSYIYHGKNTKQLSQTEKQKIALIAKSLDDGTPVKIDSEKKEIVFDSVSNFSQQNKNVENKIGFTAPIKPAIKFDDVIKKVEKNNTVENIKTDSLNREKVIFSAEKEKEKNVQDKIESRPEIKHVHGNNWDLRSQHFKTDEKKKTGIFGFSFGSKKRREEFDKETAAGKIEFSSPQKLPVEKNKIKILDLPGETKEKKKDSENKNFFGRISPLN